MADLNASNTLKPTGAPEPAIEIDDLDTIAGGLGPTADVRIEDRRADAAIHKA